MFYLYHIVFYSDDNDIVISDVYIDGYFQFALMMLLYVVWVFWLFWFVFVSGKHIISISCFLHCRWFHIRRASPSFSRSSLFEFCNNILVRPFTFDYSLSPKEILSSTMITSVRVVYPMFLVWNIGGYFCFINAFESKGLKN